MVGPERDYIAVVGSLGFSNESGNKSRLVFEVILSISGSVAAIDSFKSGSFRFFLEDDRGDKRFM